jgi:hypothetical protein
MQARDVNRRRAGASRFETHRYAMLLTVRVRGPWDWPKYVAACRRDETIRRRDETIFGFTRKNRETVTAY